MSLRVRGTPGAHSVHVDGARSRLSLVLAAGLVRNENRGVLDIGAPNERGGNPLNVIQLMVWRWDEFSAYLERLDTDEICRQFNTNGQLYNLMNSDEGVPLAVTDYHNWPPRAKEMYYYVSTELKKRTPQGETFLGFDDTGETNYKQEVERLCLKTTGTTSGRVRIQPRQYPPPFTREPQYATRRGGPGGKARRAL